MASGQEHKSCIAQQDALLGANQRDYKCSVLAWHRFSEEFGPLDTEGYYVSSKLVLLADAFLEDALVWGKKLSPRDIRGFSLKAFLECLLSDEKERRR